MRSGCRDLFQPWQWCMLLFCDESGDPGLPTKPGASPYFGVAMLCCPAADDATRLAEAQDKARIRLGWAGEFKWSKMPSDVRLAYLISMVPMLDSHRVTIWDKRSGVLSSRYSPEVTVMLRCYGSFESMEPSVRIVIDGERDRLRASEIRRALGVSEVRMERSHSCPHLQMADILIGFHAYAWRMGWRHVPKGLHHLEAKLRWCR